MRANNQGGSLAGFIIIGVLLTLVLVGGLYGLNRYNAQKTADQVATSDESKESNTAADDKQAGDNGWEKAEPSGTTAQPEKKEAPASNPTQTPAPAAPAPTPAASRPASGGNGAATQAQLPATGPADTALGMLALGSLVFAGTHFVRSRSQK